jgi:O-antigen ligase
VTVLGGAARLLCGAILGWSIWVAAMTPDIPAAAVVAAAAVTAATVWHPGAGLLMVAALTPAASLLAQPPARAAELLAWALLAAWLLCIWRPLAAPESSGAGRPRAVVVPAFLYAATLAASWLALTIAGAPGVPATALPWFVFHSVPQDHLVLSSPEPETWTALQSLTGIALLVASIAIVRDDPRLRRGLVWALVASLTVLAVVTLVDVASQWAARGYEGWFLLRYLRGERISVHLRDLNAAGSLYVLGGLTAAAGALLEPRQRAVWLPALVPIVPALGLTGSRTSMLAAIGGLLLLVVAQRRWRLTRRQIRLLLSLLGLLIVIGVATFDWEPDVRGSAGRAVDLRSQFLETTARMFASAPVFGVGVGRYFDRSAAFMPTALRELYGNENAHNYFAQQFAELGLIGGLLFGWLVCALLAAGWTAVRQRAEAPSAVVVGLFAGVGAYLLTCVTGHPLLVPEAAFPFWIAGGALVATAGSGPSRTYRYVAAVLVVGVLLMSGVARAAASYASITQPPPENGFHGVETASDGARFRWMTRHGVTYVPAGPGFVRLRLQAPPDLTSSRPLVIETAFGGRVVDRRELPPHRWVTYDLPAANAVDAPFRRIDLWTDQQWLQETKLGQRAAQRPIAVMVGEIRWIPVEDVGRR